VLNAASAASEEEKEGKGAGAPRQMQGRHLNYGFN